MSTRMAGARIEQLLAAAGKRYRDSALLQDAVETLGGAALVAGGQALFTDMSPEEIALSTLLSGAAAFGARPVAAGIGGRIGKTIDKANPNALENIPVELAAVFPGSPAAVMQAERSRRLATGSEKDVMKLLRDLQMSKYKQNFKGRGDVEGLLTAIGRYSGDNIAQLAVGLTTPMLFSDEQPPAVQGAG